MDPSSLSRRTFLVLSTILPWAFAKGASKSSPAKPKTVPVGLELWSVRKRLQEDLTGTIRAVAQMGYQGVEFYAPYFDWTETQTKDMRKLLDDLGIRCFSTHNDSRFFSAENIERARDRNLILGSKYVVMASAKADTLAGWKTVADTLNAAAEKLEPAGLRPGYHNHKPEFVPVDGQRPMDVLAKYTKPSVLLQFDVGTCLEAGADPVAWIRSNPGRIQSIHCKDWSPTNGYKALFGEGKADWKSIFAAAESVSGLEYLLIEQEESDLPELEAVQQGLKNIRKIQS
jgi:sugar phosphate isomerase/epimerase